MKLFKQTLALLFLVIWLPATNHCYLEMAGLLPTDECCTPTESSPPKSDPCETGCKLAEKAGYKTENHQFHVIVPVLISPLESSVEQHTYIRDREIDLWPPDTLDLPQFVIRKALPIRAPSSIG